MAGAATLMVAPLCGLGEGAPPQQLCGSSATPPAEAVGAEPQPQQQKCVLYPLVRSAFRVRTEETAGATEEMPLPPPSHSLSLPMPSAAAPLADQPAQANPNGSRRNVKSPKPPPIVTMLDLSGVRGATVPVYLWALIF